MSSMIKNCPHNDYPSLCSRCSIERHAGSHRKLLNDIEQARVESAEQVVVEGLRAKGLLDDEPPAPRAGEWSAVKRAANMIDIVDNEGLIASVSRWRSGVAGTEREADELANKILTEHNQHATLIGQRDQLVKIISMTICHGCHNRIGWNETPTKYGDWTKCSSCRAARELLATIEREGEA